MSPSASPLHAALAADTLVHEDAYEYRGHAILYRVYEDADAEYRHVVAGAYDGTDADSAERFARDAMAVSLKLTRVQRLLDWLGVREEQPLHEVDHVQEVTGRMEDKIDGRIRAKERHDGCALERTPAIGGGE